MINCRPISLSVFVSSTPHSNATLRPEPPSVVTVALVLSVAVMLRRGFIGSPKNSTYPPSLMLNVLSGMTGSEYFISPLPIV